LHDYELRHVKAVDGSVLTEESKRWNELLSGYPFTYFDDFDKELLLGLQRGYFDFGRIRQLVETKSGELGLLQLDQEYLSVWDSYHNSIEDNANEILEGFSRSIKQNSARIAPHNAAGTFNILEQLGFQGEVKDLLEHYVATWEQVHPLFDVDASGIPVSYEPLLTRLRESLRKHKELPNRDIEKTIVDTLTHWSAAELRYIDGLDLADFELALRKSADPKKLIRAALRLEMTIYKEVFFAAPYNGTPFAEKARPVIERIAKESMVNTIRFRNFGYLSEE
jgi:hypothetical protein